MEWNIHNNISRASQTVVFHLERACVCWTAGLKGTKLGAHLVTAQTTPEQVQSPGPARGPWSRLLLLLMMGNMPRDETTAVGDHQLSQQPPQEETGESK